MQILADVGYSATTPGLLGILFVGIGMTIVIPFCSFVVTRNTLSGYNTGICNEV